LPALPIFVSRENDNNDDDEAAAEPVADSDDDDDNPGGTRPSWDGELLVLAPPARPHRLPLARPAALEARPTREPVVAVADPVVVVVAAADFVVAVDDDEGDIHRRDMSHDGSLAAAVGTSNLFRCRCFGNEG
jgi:hypothetical protein